MTSIQRQKALVDHKNFCRSMAKQFMETLGRAFPPVPEITRKVISNAMDLYTASQKFILPEDGRLLDDPAFKALDETRPLNLPFPFIALEYTNQIKHINQGESPSSKRIVFARDREDGIVMTIVFYADIYHVWVVLPECYIPKVNYLNRKMKDRDGNVAIHMQCVDPSVPKSDLSGELGALIGFLNALQCSNIHIEKSYPKKVNKKVKSALPFDVYHILTVDLNHKLSDCLHLERPHRSPREHLRRGHVRRYPNGISIWINNTVVNAGKGFARVDKDYRMVAQ